ncbi:MAG: glucose-6-phosphate dehydrogenase [Candidatus Omnitrophota bacterium]|jgi:glucose-6-phosphate 1-dehydrogenase
METSVPIKITAHDQLCIERAPYRPCSLVIFGATGDLAHRKLFPALFNLYREKLLPKNFFILGAGRKTMDDGAFRKLVTASLNEGSKRDRTLVEKFSESVYYAVCNYAEPASFEHLREVLYGLCPKYETCGNSIFYLSLPPEVYGCTIRNLMASKLLAPDNSENPCTQLVVEKPFGQDLASARSLKETGLSDKQIYLIDHYLGKETVQNILMLRFANSIFEPVWNRQHIDHVQITASESLGVEHRAGYYESAGVFRDMFQNHMLELLALVAMEPPLNFDSAHYRDEKVKVLKSIRPIVPEQLGEYLVRGQYGQGEIFGQPVPSYREEPGVRPDSGTETFAALKLFVDNWRWRDVPFYLRSGKRLGAQTTEIIVQFKPISHSIFAKVTPAAIPPNKICIRIQPNEGIRIIFNAKHPGPKMCMATLGLEFDYTAVFHEKDLSAYDRLILDCMHGDPTLFVRQDMVELSWAFVESILSPLQSPEPAVPLQGYPAGTWGPPNSDELIRRDGRSWGL